MKNRAEREKFAPGKVAMPARQEYRSIQKPRVPRTKVGDKIRLNIIFNIASLIEIYQIIKNPMKARFIMIE